MNHKLIFAAAAIMVTLLAGLPATTDAQSKTAVVIGQTGKRHKERHPEMRKAIAALQRAKSYLQHADRAFAGHRSKAVDAVNAALDECKAALKADKN